ncbi:hypothetical protein WHZ78_16625 [Bradyrhizobium symbiodeficiens]|uniref:hypothetical protein n=1 Tax=Bradyrhizobium symbiodeficiens TaxID=1404367 RepID=UPI0030D33314
MSKGWGRPFEEPIEIASREPLRTLMDAGGYVAALPKAQQNTRQWQAAAEALLLARREAARPCSPGSA